MKLGIWIVAALVALVLAAVVALHLQQQKDDCMAANDRSLVDAGPTGDPALLDC